MKSFKKTVITVTVLSEESWDWETLGDVAHAITDGECSGRVDPVSVETMDAEATAVELEKQGSDPSFLLGEDYVR